MGNECIALEILLVDASPCAMIKYDTFLLKVELQRPGLAQ